MIQTIETSSPAAHFSEARLLLREYSHRINNELASAIGMISVAAARSANDQAKAALNAVQDQLQNYAQVHHALQMPEHSTSIDAGAYIRQLCRAISRSKLDSKGIKLVLVESAFQMNSERCWRLGLIMSELITNAARHAFKDCGGVIRAELLPSSSFIECRVTDNGRPAANIRPGHGSKIIAALASSLGGAIEQHFGPQGTTSVLIIPARP
jgi:two-component sensor histidine kinase